MKIYGSQHKNLAVSSIGGKGLNLYRLLELGLNVPNFAVLDQANLVDLIPNEIRNVDSYPEILAAIDAHVFPEDFFTEVGKHFEGAMNKLYAVRSSAVQEDGKQFSFAGQFETHLYVQWQDLQKFIKNIWKSNFSERVSTYLKTNQLSPQFGIGVVIQEMIDPDVSGNETAPNQSKSIRSLQSRTLSY